MIGQALFLIPALLLSALGAWVVGYIRLTLFEPVPVLIDMLVYCFKSLVYIFAFLGVATGVSQMTRSSNLATAFGFCTMIVMGIFFGLSKGFKEAGLWQIVPMIVPQGYIMDLAWPDAAHVAPAVCILLVLGIVYMLPGYLVMKRRDF